MRRSTIPNLVIVARSSSDERDAYPRGDGRLLCTIPLLGPTILNPKPKITWTGERERRYETIDKRVLH